jgi:hypothetical protein
MSMKIYNLATQAGLITFESIHDSMAVAPSIESVVKSKKFAQLIIKECADIALLEGQSTGNFEVFNKIQKHFGLEQ